MPYDAELECKQNVVVYDSNTSTLREEGLFTSFCFVHRIFSFWSVVVMFVWWCLMPLSNERPVASHWHTLSCNVVHIALIEIRTHNISGDKTKTDNTGRYVK